jgi:citrate lyase subunit beta-like protein
VNYKDPAYLLEECEDGRRFGFTGKQAIHPVQVDTIQKTFVPSERGETELGTSFVNVRPRLTVFDSAEISRAARIVHAMERAHNSQIGAVGLNDGNGKTEMIDAPMLKQVGSQSSLETIEIDDNHDIVGPQHACGRTSWRFANTEYRIMWYNIS